MKTVIALIAAVLVLCAAASAAPVAHANEYCVGLDANACPNGQRFQGTELQDALTEASQNGSIDTLTIGPGEYAGDPGTYSYSSPEKITIAGAGQGATTLRTSTVTDPVLTLMSPASELRDLQIVSAIEGGHALETNATVRRVTARQLESTKGGVAVVARGNATFEDCRFVGSSGSTLSASDPGFTTTIRDTSITGRSGIGINAAKLRASRLAVTVGVTALAAMSADVTIDNSLLRSTADKGQGIDVAGNGSVTADHVTIVGNGVADRGLHVHSWLGSITGLTFTNGIISGFPVTLRRLGESGQADVTLAYSAYDDTPKKMLSAGPGSLDTSRGNTNAKPQFVDPVVNGLGDALDFRLQSPSPLIDRGDPAEQAGGVDLDRLPRVVGARADMGAYENQTPPKPGEGGTGDGKGGDGKGGDGKGGDGKGDGKPGSDRVKPKLSKLKRKRSTLTFRLSERAKVTIRFDRRSRRGKYAKVKKAGVTFTARAGTNTVKLPKRLKAGSLRATLQARDLAGNKGTAKSIRFQLAR